MLDNENEVLLERTETSDESDMSVDKVKGGDMDLKNEAQNVSPSLAETYVTARLFNGGSLYEDLNAMSVAEKVERMRLHLENLLGLDVSIRRYFLLSFHHDIK